MAKKEKVMNVRKVVRNEKVVKKKNNTALILIIILLLIVAAFFLVKSFTGFAVVASTSEEVKAAHDQMATFVASSSVQAQKEQSQEGSFSTSRACENLEVKVKRAIESGDKTVIVRSIKTYFASCLRSNRCIKLDELYLGIDFSSGNEFCTSFGLKCIFQEVTLTQKYYDSLDAQCSGKLQLESQGSMILDCSSVPTKSEDQCFGNSKDVTAEPLSGDFQRVFASTSAVCCK